MTFKHTLELIFLFLCLFLAKGSHNRVTQDPILGDQLISQKFLAGQKQGQKAKLYHTKLLSSHRNKFPIFQDEHFAQESLLSTSHAIPHINSNDQKDPSNNDPNPTNILKPLLIENSKNTANLQIEQSSDPPKEITIRESKENLFFGPYKEMIDTQFTKNSEGFTILLCMIMTLFFIIILKLKDSIIKVMKPFIARSLQPVARDVLILMVILTVILWIDYHFPAFFAVDVSGICLVWSIVGLIWFAYCAILLAICSFYSANVDKKEDLVPQQDEILQEYCRLSDRLRTEERLPLKDSRAYSNCEANIAYFLLRQNFIYPSHLPMQTESFLRSDFKFSEYLALCIEKAVESLFKFSFFTFLSIFIIAVCWLILTSFASDVVSLVLFSLITPCTTLGLLIIKIKFMMIEQKLRSLIGNPHDIHLIPLDCPIEAGINLKNHIPLYLSLNLPKKSDEDFSSYFKTKFENQHEKLFWWGAPKIWLIVFQMVIIGQLTWAVIFYGYYLDGSKPVLQIIFAIIASLLLILNIFLHLPTNFLIYTTITNIEMMKDKELIKRTITSQREAFQQALIKFYRLIKARRRKSLTPEDEDEIVLKAFNVTLIHDAFTQINHSEDLSIEAKDLPTLAHLCGTNLEKDEIAMIKKETLTENNRISIDGILYTVEQNTQEVKIEPFQTSYDVLSKFDPMNQSISVEQLKKTLDDEYGDVLSKDEINSITHELKYLSTDRSQVDLLDLSLFIRDGIEQRPR